MSDSISIVIFGASGDLTARKLIPALFNVYRKERLPEVFNIIGVSRSEYAHDAFRDTLRQKAQGYNNTTFPDDAWARFAKHIWYVPGNATESASYHALKQFLEDLEGSPANRLYYLSTAPSLYGPTVQQLGAADMVQEKGTWRHVVIEKPFGYDLKSAHELNSIIHEVLQEHQVYRIDHYLGKETAQNILFFRFANTIFEPLWNRNYIDNVQISVTESVDVGHRADYYDKSGVLRDMFQNHLLQLLTLIAMEPPISFQADDLRNEKAKLLHSVRPINLQETVRAQYDGYCKTEGVAADSQTPTFAALKLSIDNWRWQGVPFYLRSGKALKRKTSEINIVFKCPPVSPFGLGPHAGLPSNVLSICIQPDEGINLKFETKVPDSLRDTRPVEMGFEYCKYFGDEPLPDAYERLILDAVKGDASLFTRSDSIEAAWQLIDPVIEGWANNDDAPPLTSYGVGSWGPAEADALLESEGRTWRFCSG